MKRFFYIILAIFPVFALAQKEDSIELSKTIQVYSEYKPQISEVTRISVNPKINDTLNLQVNLKYNVSPSPLKTSYQIIPLKAVSVKGDKLQELYRGEATIGLGNYWNGLLSVRYATERSRLKQSGVEFFHSGSAGKVKLENDQKVHAGYSIDYANLYWKRFYDDFTIYASAKGSFESVLQYGYDLYDWNGKSQDTTFEKEDIRKNLFDVSLNGGIISNTKDEDEIVYDADFKYNLSYITPENLENFFNVSGNVKKMFGEILTGVNADFKMSAVNFDAIDTKLSKNESVLRIKPFIKVSENDWSLYAGLKATPLFGGISAFKLFPDMHFMYDLKSLKMAPYIKYYGGVEMKSINEMFEENPYIADNMLLRPTITKFDIDLGINGRIKKLISYNLDFSISSFDDMYFWYGDTTAYKPTIYTAVYDDGKLTKLHGNVEFLFRKVNFGINANYYNYNLDSLANPYHKNTYDLSFSARFMVLNPNTDKTKLTIEPQLYFKGIQQQETNTVDNVVDAGLEMNYFYNSKLLIYLDVNNIFGNDYRYMNYPCQRANFMLGLSYSFGGHKE